MSFAKRMAAGAGALAALVLSAGCAMAQDPAGQSLGTSSPAPAGPQDPYAGRKKLLVWADVQTGFHHDSMNRAMAAIEQIGRESGDWVTFIRTDSQLITRESITGQGARYEGRRVNARNLDDFDAVFVLGSGEGTLSEAQKADLLAFVSEGKGLVGGHASTIAFYDWPEYGEMLGGVMAGEFRVAPHRLIVEDSDFPGAAAFPTTFADQYQYLDRSYEAGDVHVILRLDPESLSPEQRAERPDGDFPVVWAREHGQGRVFVSTFGHLDAPWDEPAVRNLYREGIRWALGLTEADISHDQ